jgi:oligopeptidase A
VSHPFLDPAFHIRWSELTPEHIVPDMELALKRAGENIERIASLDLGSLTFANTFLALEDATDELNVAWGKVANLQSVADGPALRAAHNEMLPKISAFYAGIPLNAALWERLKAAAGSPSARQAAGIHRRLLEETVADFRQAGADLPAEKRARLQAVQTELAEITQKYSENVLDATNAWQLVVDDEHRLAGLPDHAKEAARRNAEGKGLGSAQSPKWRFTLNQPSLEPFLIYAEDAALRRELWEASAAVGSRLPHDNTGLIRRILALRAEKAELLGKSDFADTVLERRMAKSGASALDFIEDFQRRCAGPFAKECLELEKFRKVSSALRGAAAPAVSPVAWSHLSPWEVAYWSEKLRRDRYDFDEEVLRPYFPIDRVIGGLFKLAGEVFGLRVKERAQGEVEVWHPEVKFYDAHDSRGRHVGSFYADWHPRESKRGGAWMAGLITGTHATSPRSPHLGLICGNLSPPGPGRPALLTHREVETVFHEFGHLIHHLLGEVEIKSLNGTNVAWDFVELPSQIMENWCWERESLDLFARHFENGERIPEPIFLKMTAARNFRAACATMRQVAFAKMDLLVHRRAREFAAQADLEPAVRAAIADCLVPTEPPAPTIIKRFTHIFSDPVGYAAGYYSYKWAEVLEADAFTRFRREGIFNARVGAEFVDKILSRGNSADPAQLFRDFMGRDPDLQALLARDGLI